MSVLSCFPPEVKCQTFFSFFLVPYFKIGEGEGKAVEVRASQLTDCRNREGGAVVEMVEVEVGRGRKKQRWEMNGKTKGPSAQERRKRKRKVTKN
jgi:hypothetical protein